MSEADDREFATRAMARLRGDMPPAGMARRLRDAYAAARPGRRARLAALLWPGMPLWAPGAALAMSLLLGIGVGVALPAPMAGRAAFSLEEPPSVSVESLLMEER
jgi:hypothetical protein